MGKKVEFERIIEKSKEYRRYHIRGFLVIFSATFITAVAFFVSVGISVSLLQDNVINAEVRANGSSDEYQDRRYTVIDGRTLKEYLSEEQIAAEDKWIENEKHRIEEAQRKSNEAQGIYTPPAGEKIVYLTFDDGPSEHTGRLLDILNKYNIKATFFVTCSADKHRDLIKRMADEGHSIGLHSCSHDYAKVYANEDSFFNEMGIVSNIVKDVTGEETKLIRFPGGSSNTVSRQYNNGIMSRLAAELGARGYSYFDWNVGSSDAGNAFDVGTVYNNITRSLKGDYSIVLQHDIKGYSVDAVEAVIQFGQRYGFTFKALDAGSPTAHHRINN